MSSYAFTESVLDVAELFLSYNITQQSRGAE